MVEELVSFCEVVSKILIGKVEMIVWGLDFSFNDHQSEAVSVKVS